MSEVAWVESALQLIISGFPSAPPPNIGVSEEIYVNLLADLTIRTLLGFLKWKILLETTGIPNRNFSELPDPAATWNTMCEKIEQDSVWHNFPSEHLAIFEELRALEYDLPLSSVVKLLEIITNIEPQLESIAQFLGQIYEECRNFDLKQVQGENTIVVRLKPENKGYISLHNLLSTPDNETILNLLPAQPSEQQNLDDEEDAKIAFQILCGDTWSEVEQFNVFLQEYSNDPTCGIFAIIDPKNVKVAGEFFLQPIRSLRKGAGVYFTTPKLVGPTVDRTIGPLCYSNFNTSDSTIKSPEEIAEIKVLDPAVGAGSFLFFAMDYIASKFLEAVEFHQRILGQDNGNITVQINEISGEVWTFENQQDFDERIQAECRTYITSHCIFGVDIDPIAVEIIRFLICLKCSQSCSDKKLITLNTKVGNSLIGAWAHDLVDYPEKAKDKSLLDEWCASFFEEADIKAKSLHFFHWELEFPEVFRRDNPGFDIILGNPPWEIVKPNSKEFFGKIDPLYPNLSKQAALRRQKQLFSTQSQSEDDWYRYTGYFKAFSNWVKNRFQHQGRSDLNLFKLFAELSLALLRHEGRLGLVLPSGFYSDKGTQELRTFYLNSAQVEWLYSFENTKNIFPIHRNFKFCILIAQKSGSTTSIRAKFMEKDLADWNSPDPETIEIPLHLIQELSPKSATVPEFLDQREVAIIDKIYHHGTFLGSPREINGNVKYATEFHMTNDSTFFQPISHWDIKYAREFDMTQDSSVFNPRSQSLESRYEKDEFEVWRCAGKPALLPLYEGKLIGQFDFAKQAYAGGRGLRSKWIPLPYSHKVIEPQYLLSEDVYETWPKAVRTYKIGFRNIARAVDPRTMVASFLDALPCLNGVPVFQVAEGDLQQTLFLVGILNSYVYDFVLKIKCVGVNLNYFILEETPVLKTNSVSPEIWAFLCTAVACLNLLHNRFAPAWLEL